MNRYTDKQLDRSTFIDRQVDRKTGTYIDVQKENEREMGSQIDRRVGKYTDFEIQTWIARQVDRQLDSQLAKDK